MWRGDYIPEEENRDDILPVETDQEDAEATMAYSF